MRANVFVFILILFLSGCGGGSSGENGPDPFNPGTDPVIALSVVLLDANCDATTENTFANDSSICVQATLTSDGTASSGEVVSFALDNAVGTLSAGTALTNASGVAQVTITGIASTTGAATLTATFGTNTASQSFEFTEGAPAATTNLAISLLDNNCNVVSVSSFSTEQSLCIRAVLITDGVPVAAEIINFSLNNAVATLDRNSALTNNNGIAEVVLSNLNGTIGAGTITATFGTETDSVNFEYSSQPPDQVQTLAISVLDNNCDTVNEPVFTADEAICIRAELSTNNSPLAGEIINFAINSSIGALDNATALTNTNGIAEVNISNSTGATGATSITATFGQLSSSANFEYTPSTVGSTNPVIVIEMIADGRATNSFSAGENVAIRATFVDGNNSAISGEIISFSVNNADISISPTTALTNTTGTASSTLVAANTALGAFVLTASATVNSQAITSTFNFQVLEATTAPLSNQLSLAVLNSSCVAADQSFGTNETICLQATLLNSESNPVANEIINFSQSSTLGTLSTTSALTNSQGIAQITIANSSATVGAATINATFESLTQSLNYEYVAVEDSSSAAPTLSVAVFFSGTQVNSFVAGTTPVVRATVVDANGTTVENVIVTYALQGTGPVISPTTALTGSTGVAEIGLTATDSDLGAYSILASATVDNINISSSVNFAVTDSGAASGTTIMVGHFNSSNEFVENIIGTTVADENSQATISAGATVGFEVALVDRDKKRITTPTPISFTSTCVSSGQATIDATVNTINGVASATFEDTSCAGASGNSDQIVASVVINNSTTTLVRDLTIQAESIGAISFISASPDSIVLTGTGGQNNSSVSTLTFQVNGELGNPLSQQNVSFVLNTTAGGLALDPSSGLTNSNGQVSTRVTAGTIPTPVRVTASVSVNSSTTIQTQSDLLTVNTGLPDQNSFNIAASNLNPEAFNISGQTVTITARLADAFNNPVPNGTTVNFTTESGSIESNCLTGEDIDGIIAPGAEDTGTCSVTWTSQSPYSADHRNTILAYAIGHETLFDSNGNNAYEIADGDPIDDGTDNGRSITGFGTTGFVDHSEAWVDFNEDGIYDSFEPFFDFNGDNQFTAADQKFNGPQCNFTEGEAINRCDGASSIHIRRSLVMITSSSAAYWRMYVGQSTDSNDAVLQSLNNVYATNDPNISNVTFPNSDDDQYTLGLNETIKTILVFYDTAEQVMPSGTQLGRLDSDGNISVVEITVNNTNQSDSTLVPGNIFLLSSNTSSSTPISLVIDSPSGSRTSINFQIN